MAHISTGTQDAHSEHTTALAILGSMIAYGIPVAIAIAGIANFGWGAISWDGAAVGGAWAAFAFLVFAMVGEAVGVTKMNILDLLGSIFAPPHSKSSQALGFFIQLINGALLGVAYAYGLLLAQLPAGWSTGVLWGIILWVLSLILMTSIGGVHPAIRRHLEDDPGLAATNFGRMTPLGTLIGHAIYGVVLGLLYQQWQPQ